MNWRILQYFNLYRVLIATLAAAVTMLAGSLPPFGEADPKLFGYVSVIYTVFSLLAVQATHFRQLDFETQAGVFAFGDVAFLTLLMHASGGLESGLGLLLIVAIAISSFLLGRKMTFFFASIAAMAILIEYSWPVLTQQQNLGNISAGLPQVGLLGIALFAIAGLVNTLSDRLRLIELLAERRGADLANMAQINDLIIQNMQSGVLVCNKVGRIGALNFQARKFFGLPHHWRPQGMQLSDVSKELDGVFKEWHNHSGGQQRAFRTQTGHLVLPHFVAVGKDQTFATLVFLDDAAVLKQQAQQLKMAALARLTASIAHEIRNPLGAISNAAQLLAESIPDQAQDRRLVQIIEDHCRRMNSIIENITQLARRDRVNLVRLDLAGWLNEFILQYNRQTQTPDGAIVYEGDDELPVCADSDQLYQVVINLCNNALRHCPKYSGTPLVHFRTGTHDDKRPFLDICDQGPGIAPDIRENIFDPFFTTASNGTGLGLYIARELCEGSGGSLVYLPDQGPGASFRITFVIAGECRKEN